MLPRWHIIFGFLFILLVWQLFPEISFFYLGLILFGAIFIDFDHYAYYVYKKKNLSLKKAYNWFIEFEKKFLSLPKNQRNNFYCGFLLLPGSPKNHSRFLFQFFGKIAGTFTGPPQRRHGISTSVGFYQGIKSCKQRIIEFR